MDRIYKYLEDYNLNNSTCLDDVAYTLYLTHQDNNGRGHYMQQGFYMYVNDSDEYYKKANIIIRKEKLIKIESLNE